MLLTKEKIASNSLNRSISLQTQAMQEVGKKYERTTRRRDETREEDQTLSIDRIVELHQVS